MELDKVLEEDLDGEEGLEEILDEGEVIQCIVCETVVESYWDPRYRGFRAACRVCGFNWAES